MTRGQRTKVRHGIAAAAGIAVFAAVFFYTGEADLWLAAQCGIGTALILFLFAHFNDSGTADEDV